MSQGAGPSSTPAESSHFISLKPRSFFGIPSDNAEQWLGRFNNWASLQQLSDIAKLSALPLFLEGLAADWVASLTEQNVDTWEHLINSFKQRFFPNELQKWRALSELWSRNQKPTESVDEYVTNIRCLARQASANDDQQINAAIIKGLRDNIRLHVLQSDHNTTEEILKAARIAEQAVIPNSSVDLLSAINDIKGQLDRMAVRRVASPVPRSQSPGRRVHFSSNQPGNRSPSPRRVDQTIPVDQPQQFNNLGPWTTTYKNVTGTGGNYDYNTDNSIQACQYCGRHHGLNRCFARNLVCRFCGKLGHLQRVCRSARRMTPQ